MTFDAAQIARLRLVASESRLMDAAHVLALLDELEKAQADGQRQYEHNVEQIAKFAAMETERDRLQALLREAQWRFINLRDAIKSSVAKTVGVQICEEQIARIAAELGDKP